MKSGVMNNMDFNDVFLCMFLSFLHYTYLKSDFFLKSKKLQLIPLYRQRLNDKKK